MSNIQKRSNGFSMVLSLVILSIVSSVLVVVMLLNASNIANIQLRSNVQQLHEARMLLIRLFWSKPNSQSFNQWKTTSDVVDVIKHIEEGGTSAELRGNPLRLVIRFKRESIARRVSDRLAESNHNNQTVSLIIPETFSSVEQSILFRRAAGKSPSVELNSSIELMGFDVRPINRVGTTLTETSKLNGDSVTSDTMTTDTLVSSSSYVSSMNLSEGMSDIVDVDSSLVESVGATEVVTTASHITLASTDRTRVSELFASNMKSNELRVAELDIEGNVVLTGNERRKLNSALARLENLEASINDCVNINQWCLPASKPELTEYYCEGCLLEQKERNFNARISLNVAQCIHGCAIDISAPHGLSASCSKSTFSPHDSGPLVCSVTDSINASGEYNYTVYITATSLKDASKSQLNTVELKWRKLPEQRDKCYGYIHVEQIQNSTPQMYIEFIIPDTALNSTHKDYQSGGECQILNHGSYYNCSVEQVCGSNGFWQPIVADCECSD